MTSLVRPKLLVVISLLALIAWPTAAFAGNGGFAPVEPASPNGDAITTNFWFVTVFALAILVLVEGLLIAFVVRYRRGRRPADADGAQVHGSTRLEIMWTLAPVVVLFAIAVVVILELPDVEDVPAATASDPNLVVKVTGAQFYWRYEYPNGALAVDTLRAPVGRVVELQVSAPDYDVIHSWWIPALGGKIDAIPGTVNRTWFRAERTGVYKGQCAELCGLEHARMLARVEVLPQAEFDSWLQKRARSASALGEETYVGVCAKCHGLSGEGGGPADAPPLGGSALINDTEAMESLLRNGRDRMPAVGKQWNTTQMRAIIGELKERFGNGNES